MTNKNKIKGSAWEHDVVVLLNQSIDGANFRRIPGSGAIGTSLSEPLLTGDVSGSVDDFPKKFRVECKVGYNSSTDKEVKQFTLKKEWLDKIAMEAKQSFSIPFLAGKFSGARSGAKNFIVMDLDTFVWLINEYTELKRDLDKVLCK